MGERQIPTSGGQAVNLSGALLSRDQLAPLLQAIEAASRDPAQLRKLVYVMAWHNLRPDAVLAGELPTDLSKASNIIELQRMLEFRRLIDEVEANLKATELGHESPDVLRSGSLVPHGPVWGSQHEAGARDGATGKVWPSQPMANEGPYKVERRELSAEFSETEAIRQAVQEFQLGHRGYGTSQARAPAPKQVGDRRASMTEHPAWDSLIERLDGNDHRDSIAQDLDAVAEQSRFLVNSEATSKADSSNHDTSPERNLGTDPLLRDAFDNHAAPASEQDNNAVVLMPEQHPAWLYQSRNLVPQSGPRWQTHPIHVSVEVPTHPRALERRPTRTIFSVLQLVAAAVVGVAIYVGILGWLQPAQQLPISQSTLVPSSPLAIAGAMSGGQTEAFRPSLAVPPMEPNPSLPFPLPKSYGVYLGGEGKLVELEPLPIKVPDHRIQLSAEITAPSRITAPTNKLAFVVFRRNLVNSAPQTVSVRVVAQVRSAMRFVDGKPITSPIEGAWRIRSKSFEFKVAPLHGHPEIIVIQPDAEFVFPAGRYALVLNGVGYDFSVPGAVTSSVHCLEQAEMVTGTVLSECAKS